MEIKYYPQVEEYVNILSDILKGEEIRRDAGIEINLQNVNAFNYARTISPAIANVGDLRLEMLKEAGLEGIQIPFFAFNPRITFNAGTRVSALEIAHASRVLETYSALQSIQRLEDVEKRERLEAILEGRQ